MTAERDYLIEFIPIGNAVKVSAVDTVSGVEVSIVGPVNASESYLSRTAIKKLEYVLARKRREGGDSGDGNGTIV